MLAKGSQKVTVRSHRWYRWKECSVFSPFKHPLLSTGVQVHGLAIGSRFLLHSFPMGGRSFSLRGHNPIWDCYFISLAVADISNRNGHTSAPKHTTDFPRDSVPVQTRLSYQDSGFPTTRLTKVNSHILTVPAKKLSKIPFSLSSGTISWMTKPEVTIQPSHLNEKISY